MGTSSCILTLQFGVNEGYNLFYYHHSKFYSGVRTIFVLAATHKFIEITEWSRINVFVLMLSLVHKTGAWEIWRHDTSVDDHISYGNVKGGAHWRLVFIRIWELLFASGFFCKTDHDTDVFRGITGLPVYNQSLGKTVNGYHRCLETGFRFFPFPCLVKC